MAYPNDSIEAVMELERQRLAEDTRYDGKGKLGGYCAVCGDMVVVGEEEDSWEEEVYCARHSIEKRGEVHE